MLSTTQRAQGGLRCLSGRAFFLRRLAHPEEEAAPKFCLPFSTSLNAAEVDDLQIRSGVLFRLSEVKWLCWGGWLCCASGRVAVLFGCGCFLSRSPYLAVSWWQRAAIQDLPLEGRATWKRHSQRVCFGGTLKWGSPLFCCSFFPSCPKGVLATSGKFPAGSSLLSALMSYCHSLLMGPSDGVKSIFSAMAVKFLRCAVFLFREGKVC